jgi:hypothetical protein
VGLRSIYAAVEAAVEAIVPTSYASQTFVAVDGFFASGAWDDQFAQARRPFDIGAAVLPRDDGEAGAPSAGSLRLRVSSVIRVGYLAPTGGSRRDLEVQIGEDCAAIRTALMGINTASPPSSLISIDPPGDPSFARDDHQLTVVVPFDIIYREA